MVFPSHVQLHKMKLPSFTHIYRSCNTGWVSVNLMQPCNRANTNKNSNTEKYFRNADRTQVHHRFSCSFQVGASQGNSTCVITWHYQQADTFRCMKKLNYCYHRNNGYKLWSEKKTRNLPTHNTSHTPSCRRCTPFHGPTNQPAR